MGPKVSGWRQVWIYEDSGPLTARIDGPARPEGLHAWSLLSRGQLVSYGPAGSLEEAKRMVRDEVARLAGGKCEWPE